MNWLKRWAFQILIVVALSYSIFPEAWWFLPRLLAGEHRAMYGTYRGTLTADDGGDPNAADAHVQVSLTLRPSAHEVAMTSHGHHFEPFFTAPDSLAGAVDVVEADGTVDHYRLHGYEQARRSGSQTIEILNDETFLQIAADIKGNTLTFTNFSLLRAGTRVYGGTLVKR